MDRKNLPLVELAEICRRYRVRELAVFGSAARGEQRPDSDIDLLVEFEADAPIGFVELNRMEREISELLHVPVDLVEKDGLKPMIRDDVLAESRIVYAA